MPLITSDVKGVKGVKGVVVAVVDTVVNTVVDTADETTRCGSLQTIGIPITGGMMDGRQSVKMVKEVQSMAQA